MKIKFGELNARMLCQYTAVAEVAAAVFGKKDENPVPAKGEYEDLAAAPSFDAALANINRALRFG